LFSSDDKIEKSSYRQGLNIFPAPLALRKTI
jgi:hypothetical protein